MSSGSQPSQVDAHCLFQAKRSNHSTAARMVQQRDPLREVVTLGVDRMDERSALLTPQQVAGMLQVSVGTVLRLLRSSRLRGVRLGRHWRVRAIDLEAYLEGASVQQPPATGVVGYTVGVPPEEGEARPRWMPTGWKAMGLVVIALMLLQVALLCALVVMSANSGSSLPVQADGAAGPASGSTSPTTTPPSAGLGLASSTPAGASAIAIAAESTPRPAPGLPGPSAATPGPSPQPSATTRATKSAKPAPLIVGNTGGWGVFIRLTPKASDRVRAWPDGTIMLVIGEDCEAEGRVWKNVMDPSGIKGWVPAEYLVPAPLPTALPLAERTGVGSGYLLELLATTSYSQGNLVVVEGQVRNISGGSLRNVEVLVQWYSSEDEFIKEESAPIEYDPILHNQVSPFRLITTRNPAMARFTVKLRQQLGAEIPTLDSRQHLGLKVG